MKKIVILGAGIAGISAAYHLKKRGIPSVVFEKDKDWGGLCGNFTIHGFRFDRFIHMCFTKNEYVLNLFKEFTPFYARPFDVGNYYKGYWLRHPTQNNLFPLSAKEKVKIISDFVDCAQKPLKNVETYDQWLCARLGNYFARNFAFVYNRKYWGLEPKALGTQWIGPRVHVPNVEEVLSGAFEENHKNFSYVGNRVFYPRIGGFRSFLNKCRQDLIICCDEKVIKIVPTEQKIIFASGREAPYDYLISSIPLPEIVKIIQNCPQEVLNAGEKLHWTQGYLVSLGFRRLVHANFWCFYIYDKQILPARAYFPNLESLENVPNGCSSLQAEIYWDCKQKRPNAQLVLDKTVQSIKEMCNVCEKDLVIKDIRWEPYANVTFTHDTYHNRQIVIDYLHSLKIETIGRFGKWDYLWSDQAFESGRKICDKIFKGVR